SALSDRRTFTRPRLTLPACSNAGSAAVRNTPAKSSKIFRRHHLLALVPLLALLFSPYIANKLEPRILGMPFLLGWIVVWVLLTSVVMFVIQRLDGDEDSGD